MMKDLKYNINFEERKRSEITTELITGYLESIYLSVTKPISVEIYSLDNPDIILYKSVDFSGSKNLNLRCEHMRYDNTLFNYSNSKWALNEKIGFIFKGTAYTKVEVRVRYNA